MGNDAAQDLERVLEAWNDQRVRSMAVARVYASLQDIGFDRSFSDTFVNDVLCASPDQWSIRAHDMKIVSDYHARFHERIVPGFYAAHILPLVPRDGVIVDIGCGDGLLAEMLTNENKNDVVGIDVAQYAWSKRRHLSAPGVSGFHPRLRLLVEEPEYVFTSARAFKPSTVVMTWALHHMPAHEQEKAFTEIAKLLPHYGRLVALEDSYSTRRSPLEGAGLHTAFMELDDVGRRKLMLVYDWIANKALFGRDEIAMPGSYRTLEEWCALGEKNGLHVHAVKYLGFPSKRDIDTPQSVFVLEKP